MHNTRQGSTNVVVTVTVAVVVGVDDGAGICVGVVDEGDVGGVNNVAAIVTVAAGIESAFLAVVDIHTVAVAVIILAVVVVAVVVVDVVVVITCRACVNGVSVTAKYHLIFVFDCFGHSRQFFCQGLGELPLSCFTATAVITVIDVVVAINVVTN